MNTLESIYHTALHSGDRPAFRSRSGEITYSELWEKSGKLAKYLNDKLEDNVPVMLYGHKEPEMIVSIVACIRSGHAYCPVDIGMTDERTSDIADVIGTELVLAPGEEKPALADKYTIIDKYAVNAIFEMNQEEDSDCSIEEDNDRYIIFTSGSTGKPKGVRITNNNVENYLIWARTLGRDGNDAIPEGCFFLNQAPFSFDLSVMDLYLSLSTGGTLISLDKELNNDIGAMLSFLSDNQPNYWISTPSFADLCLSAAEFSGETLSALGCFLFCGETLPVRTAAQLIKRFPAAKVINTYGPTESTVCVTSVEITEEMTEELEVLPIGRVKPGTSIYLEPETNEIVIAGNTVSPGYYKDKAKTGKSFFTADIGDEKLPAYRTGDKGHFDKNGVLYYDGRIDRQIKLHGYRIELDDIEINLMNITGVSGAAVIPISSDGKVASLAAFVVRDTGSDISDDYSGRKHIRQELQKKLPSYMVPKRIMFVDNIPLSNNGKTDRKKLEEMI